MIAVLLLLFFQSSLAALPFAYDRATHCAQTGDWNGALHQLQDLVVDNPESAAMLYDAGVAAFHTDDMGSARIYFERASDCTRDLALQEKSLINAGTLYAKNGDFKTAVSFLERAVALNPNNESAQKKLEEFKKKLEEDQQKNNDKNNDNAADDEEEKEKEKKEQQENGDNDNNSNDKSESDQQQKSESSSEQQKGESGGDDDDSGQKDESKKSDDNTSPNNSAENQSGASEKPDSAENSEDDANNDDEPSDAAEQPDAAKRSETDTAAQQNSSDEEKKGTVATLNEALDKEENEWMRSLLERYEGHDIAGNKQLLRARLQQGGSENAHTKNW
jgi:tetratricopeptide repeat protein